MAELQRVPLDRPPPRNWLPTLGSVGAIFLGLAILKPWGGAIGPGPSLEPAPSARRVGAPTERPPRTEYDPRLFGIREPDPAWELWPAGYVVEFGIAGPLAVAGQHDPSLAPGASGGPGVSPSPGDVASPSPASSGGPPGPDDHVVNLGPADHLVALGINTPADVRVAEVILWLEPAGRCCDSRVGIVRLPTLWDSRHFIVIGVEDPERPGQAGPWLPGEYRLDLVTSFGETREVRLRITPPID